MKTLNSFDNSAKETFSLRGLLLPHTHTLLVLMLSSAFAVAMLALRMYYTRTPSAGFLVWNLHFGFLVWNLILAWIPFGISTALRMSRNRLPWLPFLALAGLWLLFFPNCAYIITDFLHLRSRDGIPLWYDVLLLLSFAWTGLMLGIVSLLDMQLMIEKRTNKWLGWLFAFSSLALGSFGIYLGRVLRWNSWDIFTQPSLLLRDIADRVLHPFQHSQTVAMTVMFTVFMLLVYMMVQALRKRTA